VSCNNYLGKFIQEANVRQLFSVLALIALGCTASLAQRQAGQDSTSQTPQTSAAPVSKTPVDFDQIRALIAAPALNQSQGTHQKTTAKPQPVIWQDVVFVVRDGAVYQPLLNGTVLVGIPGGGASGCFSLNLPQRIAALNEYLRKLQAAK